MRNNAQKNCEENEKVMKKNRKEKMHFFAYIDEYGNTGDAVKYNPAHPFGDQPIFCLSSILLKSNNAEMHSFLDTIRPNASEIKSKNMYPRWTPEAVRIFEKMATSKYKTRIELVDKKYQICSYIVNQFFLPPGECVNNLEEWKMTARLFSDKLYNELPSDVYAEYNNLAKKCTEENIQIFFDLLLKKIDLFQADDVSDYMKEALKETEDSFHNKMFAFRECNNLFLKDFGASGNELYLVPNLLSFTNLYCRLCPLPIMITIVHDNQTQFGSIMKSHKEFLVKQKNLLPRLNGVGWNPTDIRDLPFELSDSKSCRFIQVADVVSGFVGRIHLKYINGSPLTEDERKIVSIVRNHMLLNYVGPERFQSLWL